MSKNENSTQPAATTEAVKETAADKKVRIAAEKAAAKAEKTAARDAKKAAKVEAAAEKKANKKPGVIASILVCIQNSKTPVSQAQILDYLVVTFPDREKDSMHKTVRAQLGGKSQPTRMEKEKGVEFTITAIEESKDKNYSIK